MSRFLTQEPFLSRTFGAELSSKSGIPREYPGNIPEDPLKRANGDLYWMPEKYASTVTALEPSTEEIIFKLAFIISLPCFLLTSVVLHFLAFLSTDSSSHSPAYRSSGSS